MWLRLAWKDSRKLCALLQDPQPLWISSEYAVAHPPVGYPHLWPLGPSAVPGGWKKGSTAGLQTPPADPSFPPAHPYPTALLLSGPFSPAPGWARSASLQPPQRARAGEPGAVLHPLPLGEGARGGGTPELRPTAPSPSVCHLPPVSLSPRASIPGAGGGGGAADSAPPSWLLPRRLAASALALAQAPPLSYPGRPRSSRGGSHPPPGRPRRCTLRDTRAGEGGDLGGGVGVVVVAALTWVGGSQGWISVRGHLCPAPGSSGDPLCLPESRCPPLRRVSPVTRLHLGDGLELESLASPHPTRPPPRLRPFPAPVGLGSLAAGVRGRHLPPLSAQHGVGARRP